MKILISGYSGSGKSTLCRKLQERYELPSLHLDAVQFLPAWKTRAKTEQQRVVQAFLDEHPDGYPNKAIVIRNQRDLDSYLRGSSSFPSLIDIWGCLQGIICRFRMGTTETGAESNKKGLWNESGVLTLRGGE